MLSVSVMCVRRKRLRSVSCLMFELLAQDSRTVRKTKARAQEGGRRGRGRGRRRAKGEDQGGKVKRAQEGGGRERGWMIV